VIGADELFTGLGRVINNLSKTASIWRISGTVAFSIVLTVFLLLNAGVVTEIGHTDYAPGSKISQQHLLNSDDPAQRARATGCIPCIVGTHAWMINQGDRGVRVYGDEFVESQTDFYAQSLREETGQTIGPAFYTSIWSARNGVNESAYLIVLQHNIDTGGVYERKYLWHPWDGLTDVFDTSSIIYQSGKSNIYYKHKSTITHRNKTKSGSSRLESIAPNERFIG
jgi:hypothetical protein